MEFIKKIINRIINLFKNKNQKLLSETVNNVEENLNIKPEINTNHKSELIFPNELVDFEELSEDSSQKDFIDQEYANRKKEFFDTYEKFKEGKIKAEHLLITDLIDFEMMMLQEEKILEENIELESQKIENQKKELIELNEEIASLNKILNS